VVVRALCCPPPEILRGQAGRNRRLVPGTAATARWWDVEFLPLHDERGLQCLLGKITVVPQNAPVTAPLLPEKLVALREARGQQYALAQLTSSLPAYQRITDQVRLASRSSVPVLILGEPGTGKQWIARTIHELGAERGAFVALDCARLPARALTALLVGDNRHQLGLRRATCYLKEPQHLPRDLQVRLCQVLADDSDPDSPRAVAAMSGDPAEEIKAGRIVEELYCALGTLTIVLPPLRDRLADLPVLVERFLKRGSQAQQRAAKGLTAEAWEMLRAYTWPGNLRELYAALQVAVQQTSQERIDAAHLPGAVRLAVRMAETPGAEEEKKLSLDRFLEEAERRLIRLALRRAKGNRSRAAELLEVWRPRLLRRMEALGITDW
jgi:DNA-binding NtrC family response regulator